MSVHSANITNTFQTGMTDGDYPSLSSHGLAAVPLIGPVRHVPLPAELSEQFAHVQCNCIMGLLPTIRKLFAFELKSLYPVSCIRIKLVFLSRHLTNCSLQSVAG